MERNGNESKYLDWWSIRALLPAPSACKADALLTELMPHKRMTLNVYPNLFHHWWIGNFARCPILRCTIKTARLFFRHLFYERLVTLDGSVTHRFFVAVCISNLTHKYSTRIQKCQEIFSFSHNFSNCCRTYSIEIRLV